MTAPGRRASGSPSSPARRSTSSSTTPARATPSRSTSSPTRTGTPSGSCTCSRSMRLMRAFAPGMAERGWGRIVNVASSAGKRPSLTNAAYSVTKAAQLSLSRVFADTYAAQGVLVNAVAPGAVASGLWMDEGGLADQTAAARGMSREEAIAVQEGKIPLGRYATVEEIATSWPSCAPSAPRRSPAPPGRSTAAPSRRSSRAGRSRRSGSRPRPRSWRPASRCSPRARSARGWPSRAR